MTEEEAKTKWCPAYRVIVGIEGLTREYADNRGTIPNSDTSNCIGSACMAWRWTEGRGDGPVEETTESPPPDRPAGMRWYRGTDRWGLFPRRGYCGLAGKP